MVDMSWSIFASGTAAACERQVKESRPPSGGSAEEVAVFKETQERLLGCIARSQKPNDPESAVYVHKVNANGHGVELTTCMFTTELVLLK